jgi:uncharacterized membrane protein YeaQ/YmgE (transglycosylase-associated protein family)
MDARQLAAVVEADPTLAPQEKAQLQAAVRNKEHLARILSGTAGAALAVALGKYMKLGTTSKILLGLAGYGIGKLLYQILAKQDRQFTTFNDKLNVYEMDSSRY